MCYKVLSSYFQVCIVLFSLSRIALHGLVYLLNFHDFELLRSFTLVDSLSICFFVMTVISRISWPDIRDFRLWTRCLDVNMQRHAIKSYMAMTIKMPKTRVATQSRILTFLKSGKKCILTYSYCKSIKTMPKITNTEHFY